MVNVAIQFRDFLRTHITDPANRTGEWVYDNYPREGFGKDVIITVIGAKGESRPYGLSNSAWLSSQMIQIDIWARDDVGYNINAIDYYDKDLIILLADLIETTIRYKWRCLPISLIEMTDRTPISFNKDKLLWSISLTYEIQKVE